MARRTALEQAVALALEASRRPLPGFYVAPHTAPDPIGETNLADLVLASGKRLQSEGKLDAALDRYVAAARIALHVRQRLPWLTVAHVSEVRVCEQLTNWAAQSGQKPQRVLEALRTMEEQWRNPPTYCEHIKHNYLLELRFLEGDREALRELRGSTDVLGYLEFTRWLPWERARAVRLLNKLTAEEFARYRDMEKAMAAGSFVARPSNIAIPPALARDFTYNIVRQNISFARLDDWLMVETQRRATRLIMALEAWKLEHGKLPRSLEDLKGKYLDQLPVTPYYGSEFGYEPKGLPYYVAWRAPNSTNMIPIEPGRPFVDCDSWSTTLNGMHSTAGLGPSESPAGSAGAASPKTQFWTGGWVFPIP